MNWSRTEQLRAFMRLPWTVTTERNEEGDYLVARVVEIPDAIATGKDDVALAKDLWNSLWSSLSARLEFGDDIPRPAGSPALPWENPIFRGTVVASVGSGEAWNTSFAGAAGLVLRAL